MKHYMSFTTTEIDLFEHIVFNMVTEFNGSNFINADLLESLLAHMKNKEDIAYTEEDITSFARMYLEYHDEFIYQEGESRLFMRVLKMMRSVTPGY